MPTMTPTFKELINKDYLAMVREVPCVVCHLNRRTGSLPSEAHHEGLSVEFQFYKRKNDYTAIPLCMKHHMARHNKFGGIGHFWYTNTGLVETPYYAAINMMSIFRHNEGLVMPEPLQNVIEGLDYLSLNSHHLGLFIDELASWIHYQYTTGDLSCQVPD